MRKLVLLCLALALAAAPSFSLAEQAPPPRPDQAGDYQASAEGYWHHARYIQDLMYWSGGLSIRFKDGSEITLRGELAELMLAPATSFMNLGVPVRTYVQDGQVTAVYAAAG